MATSNYKQFLIDLGFVPSGHWELERDSIVNRLHQHASTSSILYAFVSGDEVLYIGKSIQSLSARMYGYQKPGISQRTNEANNANLRAVLSTGNSVEIFVFAPGETIEYRGLPVNLAAGLEDILIERLQPEWNKAGIRRGVLADGAPELSGEASATIASSV